MKTLQFFALAGITELPKGGKHPRCNSDFMSKIEEDLILTTFDPKRAVQWNSHLHQRIKNFVCNLA